jgi:hypothetical protein
MLRHFVLIVFIAVCAASISAQQAALEGRWQGTAQTPQGERPAIATFARNGDTYTGTISGLRGEMPFKQVKVEGNKIQADAVVESPQGSIPVKYEFTLAGDTLTGQGHIEFGGQSFTLEYSFKRAAEGQATAPSQQPQSQQPPAQQPSQQRPGGQQQQRATVPQPTQKQSLDYFLGQWSFKWTGRESPITPGGTAEGSVTFSPAGDGKFIESRTEGKSADGPFRESSLIGFDEDKKILVVLERRQGGTELLAIGDWSAAISIRFTIAPIKVKGATVRLKRTISVVSAHSFTVTEELAEGDGPFQRLGNAIFTKAAAAATPASK